MLAHEIGTPVTAIQVALERLERKVSRGAGGEELELVRGQLHRLTMLTGLLRSLALPGQPQLQPVDLAALIADLAAWVSPILSREEVNLEVDEPGPHLAAWADPQQLRTVLLALIFNARQAVGMLPGPGEISIGVVASPGGARVEVRDSGPGVRPGERDRIFLPFVSGWGGPGVGLTQARRLVEGMGGELRLGDPPGGGGATFMLELPTAEQP